MKNLIVQLEIVPEGSRGLDQDIAKSLGWKFCSTGGGYYVDPADGRARIIPHFTTSLDAKVPGENITLVRFDRTTKTWKAWHEDGDILCIGEGPTEVLARRIAGLKGLDAKWRPDFQI